MLNLSFMKFIQFSRSYRVKNTQRTVRLQFIEVAFLLFEVIQEKIHKQFLVLFLGDEDTKNVQFGPIFSTVTKSNFLNQLVQWSIAKKNPPADDIKYFLVSSLLCEFDFLISQSKQNILYSASVLQPLVILLDHSSALTQTLTINLSRLLKTLCVLLCRDTLLLNFTKQVLYLTYPTYV